MIWWQVIPLYIILNEIKININKKTDDFFEWSFLLAFFPQKTVTFTSLTRLL